MKTQSVRSLGNVLVLLFATVVAPAQSLQTTSAAPTTGGAAAQTAASREADDDDDDSDVKDGSDDDVVSVGHDSRLPSDATADAVISILGSSTSEGHATDVLSVIGNTRVTGPVEHSAVAVVGNLYVDSKVDGDSVAVFGNVELGPHADVDGTVIAVLGTVRRDPAAIVHGGVKSIDAGRLGTMNWLLLPVLGFLVFSLLGILALCAVVYVLISGARARQAAKAGRTPVHGMLGAGAASSESSPPRVPAAAALPHAGFWIRMAALTVDVIVVRFAMLLLLHPFGHFQLVALAVYGAVMWKLRGSTVGGIAFDLHVLRADGRDVDWQTAIRRALGCFVSLVVAGLGFIWIAIDRDGQAWHDKIAGTVVVRAPKALPTL